MVKVGDFVRVEDTSYKPKPYIFNGYLLWQNSTEISIFDVKEGEKSIPRGFAHITKLNRLQEAHKRQKFNFTATFSDVLESFDLQLRYKEAKMVSNVKKNIEGIKTFNKEIEENIKSNIRKNIKGEGG